MPAFGLTLRMNVHRDGYAEHRQTAGCGDRANTGQGRYPLPNPRMEDDGQITVDMGVPLFASGETPFTGGSGAIVQPVELDGASPERASGNGVAADDVVA